MDIELYTLRGCGNCTKMKELLKRADVPYTEKMIPNDITKADIYENYPSMINKGFPQIVIDGEVIGGLVEAVTYFVKNKLITRASR
jgi:glutaredoxin